MTNQMRACSDNEVCVFALRGVEVVLGGKTILTEVDLDIPPGSRTAIVGRSGSGKSTMLRLLAFLLRPSSGTVAFRGSQPQPSDITSVRRSVPMVHQEPLLWGDTVRENLLRAFFYHSASDLKPPSDDRLAGLLRATGLDEKMLTSAVAKLSGGEKQRVAIARALALEPDALLLDEPTSALDLLTAEQLFDSLVEAFPGLTVVLVTHSPSLVERCNNQVLLENGRVRATRSGLKAGQLRNFLETGQ